MSYNTHKTMKMNKYATNLTDNQWEIIEKLIDV